MSDPGHSSPDAGWEFAAASASSLPSWPRVWVAPAVYTYHQSQLSTPDRLTTTGFPQSMALMRTRSTISWAGSATTTSTSARAASLSSPYMEGEPHAAVQSTLRRECLQTCQVAGTGRDARQRQEWPPESAGLGCAQVKGHVIGQAGALKPSFRHCAFSRCYTDFPSAQRQQPNSASHAPELGQKRPSVALWQDRTECSTRL